ncbi:hypothetical protein JDW21_18905 [Bacillus subtilis]|uniref:Uncharacterized protein n=1 Tax=Bacillus phage vB_BsuS_PJN02 TaxID=2920374 RepID=A0AC61TS78_9CAUD|nr:MULTISPECIES: hypothetical protein [Bacillus subtilis group]YP_010681820.1 hypothetical protein PQE76_gp202 [Bacillus phage vB_BsuS_PJN02]MCR4362123.1 hypothetical protein [Bacillus subtilis]UNH58545.1 hypothetical protein [Bacillus phage vB_BsuS_PJN02]UQB84272.1 hypothetical protein KMZ31_20375 [Bacillus amyloliquefaciens]WOF32898.1 hypothetical protein OEJ84_23655 [Bacillus subtilis]
MDYNGKFFILYEEEDGSYGYINGGFEYVMDFIVGVIESSVPKNKRSGFIDLLNKIDDMGLIDSRNMYEGEKIRDPHCDGMFGERKDLKGGKIVYHHKNKIGIRTRFGYFIEKEFPDNIHERIRMHKLIKKWTAKPEVK